MYKVVVCRKTNKVLNCSQKKEDPHYCESSLVGVVFIRVRHPPNSNWM